MRTRWKVMLVTLAPIFILWFYENCTAMLEWYDAWCTTETAGGGSSGAR